MSVPPRPAALAAPDFEALFRALPSPYMVLDRELRFVDANPAYCAVTERSRDELVGRNIFEMFPSPGEGERRLRDSFSQVLETDRSHSIPLLPYAIPLPRSRGGGFDMRYWSAVHTPLLGPDGRTRFIVQNTVDVTELQRLRTLAYGPGEEVAAAEATLLQRAQEVERANRWLEAETRSLRDLFIQAPGFMAVLAGPDLVFSLVNETYQQLVGHRRLIGRPLVEALPEVAGQTFDDILREVMRTGEPFIGRSVSVHLRRTPRGALEERFVDFIYQPMRARDGTIWGVFVEGSDVTDRVHAEAHQKLLLDELNHRVKNVLATVQAIAAQTLRSSPDPAAFREAFESRLIGLSATHDVLTAANWRGARLRDVIGVEFRPYDESRYRLEGPEVELAPGEALALGLVFHELATNAAKYGALSKESGCVEVRWTVEGPATGPARLELEWRERGGPPVTAPERLGFGSRLIERSLRGPLQGRARLEYPAAGLRCEIELPLGGQAATIAG